MIEIGAPGTLLLSRARGLGFGDGGLDIPPAAPVVLVLDNGAARFEFELDDSIGGLTLARFNASGGEVWTNYASALWRMLLRPMINLDSDLMVTVEPEARQLQTAPLEVVDTEQGQELAALWTVTLGADTIEVAQKFELRRGEDFLRCSTSAAFVGTAVDYGVDSIGSLNLRVPPIPQAHTDGTDNALCPVLFGGICRNPIDNLHYAFPPYFGQLKTGFNGKVRQHYAYPSGKEWGLAVWGYWDSTSLDGWMVNLAEHTQDIASATFQSDSQNLVFELEVPQPDPVFPGNNGQPLGTKYSVELRPFRAASSEAWVEMGRHYRNRLKEDRAYFYKVPPPQDPALDPVARQPRMYFYVNNTAVNDSRPTTTLPDFLDQAVRAAGGTPGQTAAFVLGNFRRGGQLRYPDDTPQAGVEDVREMTLAARARGYFLGHQRPGAFLPGPQDNHLIGDPASDEFHTENNWQGVYHTSKAGYLAGDTDATKGGPADGSEFWREDLSEYQVFSFVGDILTVQGNPFTVGQWGAGSKIQFTPAGGGRRAQADIVDTPATNQIHVSGSGFTDPQEEPATPALGDTVRLFDKAETLFCFHALRSSPIAQDLQEDFWVGMREKQGEAFFYADIFTLIQRGATDTAGLACYSDHSSWAKIGADYVPHPKGGGAWWLTAVREWFLDSLKQVQDLGRVEDGKAVAIAWCEWPDETSLDYFSGGLHVVGCSQFWRLFQMGGSVDGGPQKPQENPGYVMAPLMGVVHPGRCQVTAVRDYFSNGLLGPGFGRGETPFEVKIRKASGLWLGIEWCWGMTLPLLNPWGTGGNDWTDWDLWDESNWDDPLHPDGPASEEIRTQRTLYETLNAIGLGWGAVFHKNGDLLPPARYEDGATLINLSLYGIYDVDSGFAYSTAHGFSGTVVYDHQAFPAVVHSAWAGPEPGEVALFGVNWSNAPGTLDITIDPRAWGMADQAPFTLWNVDPRTGDRSRVAEWESGTFRLTDVVGQWSVGTWILTSEKATEKYRRMFWQLFPRGEAWTQLRKGVRDRFLEAYGNRRSEIEERAGDLLRESIASTPVELIDEWEAQVGLPDACSGGELAVQLNDRQRDVANKYTARGGQTQAYLQGLIDDLGVDAVIIENHPFRVGVGRCGDALQGADWAYSFTVIVQQAEPVVFFRTGIGRCGDRLSTGQNAELVCVINRAKPAHTAAVFEYVQI